MSLIFTVKPKRGRVKSRFIQDKLSLSLKKKLFRKALFKMLRM
ncbi:MAG: hypothetical protein QW534_02780 [Candidatus Methanomethylicia archaeon]